MIAMSLLEFPDGHKVSFESCETFKTREEAIEFGKQVFRILEDMDDDEEVTVQLILSEKDGLYMELRSTFEEL